MRRSVGNLLAAEATPTEASSQRSFILKTHTPQSRFQQLKIRLPCVPRDLHQCRIWHEIRPFYMTSDDIRLEDFDLFCLLKRVSTSSIFLPRNSTCVCAPAGKFDLFPNFTKSTEFQQREAHISKQKCQQTRGSRESWSSKLFTDATKFGRINNWIVGLWFWDAIPKK